MSVLGFVVRLGGFDVDEQWWQKRVEQILEASYSIRFLFLRRACLEYTHYSMSVEFLFLCFSI